MFDFWLSCWKGHFAHKDEPLGLLLEIRPLFFHSSKVCGSELPAFTTWFTFCCYTCFNLLLKPEPKPANNTLFLSDSLINHYFKFSLWNYASCSSTALWILTFLVNTKKMHLFNSNQVIGGIFRAIYRQLLGWSDCSRKQVKFQGYKHYDNVT